MSRQDSCIAGSNSKAGEAIHNMRLRIGNQQQIRGYITTLPDDTVRYEGDETYLRGLVAGMREKGQSVRNAVESLPTMLDGFYTWAHDTDRDTDPDPGTLAYREEVRG